MANAYGDPYEQIRQDLIQGKSRKALKALNTLGKKYQNPQTVPDSQIMVRHWIFLGQARLKLGKKKKAAEAWRQALIYDPEAGLDIDVSQDSMVIWRRLKVEVQHGPEQVLFLPEQGSFFQFYLDGRPIRSGAVVKHGHHLAQIRCGDGKIRSNWVKVPDPIYWRSMCGLPQFTIRNPEELKFRGGDRSPFDTVGVGLISSGGAILVSGLALQFSIVEPYHQNVVDARENPESINRDEADAITAEFQRLKMISMTLMGVGAGFALVGGGLRLVHGGGGPFLIYESSF